MSNPSEPAGCEVPRMTEDRRVACRWLVGGSAVFTVITGLAAVDMALGNPTAINAVLGCGFGACVWWAITIMVVRDGRRS